MELRAPRERLGHAELLRHLVEKLRRASDRAKTLTGMIPICSHCKSVRNAEGQWVRIDAYLAQQTHAKFTHGICSDCYGKLYRDDEPAD